MAERIRTKVFGVDPGLATGLALADITDRMSPKPLGALEVEESKFYETAEATVEQFADDLIVVCENYIITSATAKKSQAPWSLMGRGIMTFLCWKHNVPIVIQTPQETKEFATDEKLKKAGFWFVGGEGHANDAYRHIIKYHADRNPRWANTLR